MWGKRKVTTIIFRLLLWALIIAAPITTTHARPSPEITLAPGYGKLQFNAPKPGTYKLPVLDNAKDGEVIDSNGVVTSLHKLMEQTNKPGTIILLSFIYATCSDVNGCPLATLVFQKIKTRLAKMPETAKRLRLLTLSFNPEHDTPEKMREYGANLQGNGVDWRFLTTASEEKLQPILQAYKQSATKVYDGKGKFTNTFNHSLRVYLIDQQQCIRNIYNTELLHPDMVLADVKTLLLEHSIAQNAKPVSKEIANDGSKTSLYSAGDNKFNYEMKTYQTQSLALIERQGKAANLQLTINQPPLGLPGVPVPVDNPITAKKIALGRKLFYDRRLSLNNTFSCAMCHIPEQGFTSNEMATAVGVEGRTVRRNSPTLYNVAYQQSLFHDGRESTLEQQVWGPLLATNEMANPSVGYVVNKIKNADDYPALFEQAFGKAPGMETIGMALASYERTLNSANSAFDRWYFGKDKYALPNSAQQGYKLFTGKAGCSQCHVIDNALFTDHKLHNTGIGFAAAMADKSTGKTKRVQLAPGVFTEIPNEIISSVSEVKTNDLGRYEITQDPKDRWLYKTPSLRNISLTAPYMHDGSIASLHEVVAFYNHGGTANENLDPLIKPLSLSSKEIDNLTAFLESLTGDNTQKLIADAFAAPVGDAE